MTIPPSPWRVNRNASRFRLFNYLDFFLGQPARLPQRKVLLLEPRRNAETLRCTQGDIIPRTHHTKRDEPVPMFFNRDAPAGLGYLTVSAYRRVRVFDSGRFPPSHTSQKGRCMRYPAISCATFASNSAAPHRRTEDIYAPPARCKSAYTVGHPVP